VAALEANKDNIDPYNIVARKLSREATEFMNLL
jgi:hypothetical protein